MTIPQRIGAVRVRIPPSQMSEGARHGRMVLPGGGDHVGGTAGKRSDRRNPCPRFRQLPSRRCRPTPRSSGSSKKRTSSAPRARRRASRTRSSATLSDGKLTHDAHIQNIDETKREFRTNQGVEFDFRDSWTFNVAAYKIDRLIGLNMVPVSISRTHRSTPAALTWWIDDVLMDEGDKVKNKVEAPDRGYYSRQRMMMYLFDQLISNTDRNQGNIVYTKDWRLWLIDHTRAFRKNTELKMPARITRCDRQVFEGLKALDRETLKREVGKQLDDGQIKSLLARRDAIVKKLESLGPSALFDRNAPRDAARVRGGGSLVPFADPAGPGRPSRRYPERESLRSPFRRFQARLNPGAVMACQPRQVFTRFALAAAIASVLPTGRGFAQERDRSKIPDKYKWNTADLYPSEEAWRAAKDRLVAEIPKLKSFRGALGIVGGASRRRARTADAVEQGAGQGLRLRQHAVGRGHARQQVPGHAAGDGAGERAARRRGGVHRAGDPEDRSRDDRSLRRRASRGSSRSGCTSTTSSAGVPHTKIGCRGKAARRPRR